MRAGLTILALLVALIAGCSRTGEADQAVKGVVMRYTHLVAEGYANMNMTPLREVATVEESTRAYHHMAALGEARTRMISHLKKMEFLEIASPGEGRKVVRTRETWDFMHRHLDSDKVLLEEKDFIYLVTYELQKEGDRWVISRKTAMDGKPEPMKP